MAEFQFRATWEDSAGYLEKLTSLTKYTFVVRKSYPNKTPLAFSTANADILELLNKKGFPLLLFYGSNTIPPLFYMRLEKSGDFLLRAEKSTPSIELGLPHGARKEKKTFLYPGWLLYPSRFINPETNEIIPPPEEIKQGYKLIQKILKMEMKQYYTLVHKRDKLGALVPSFAPCWIGRNALHLLERGDAVIPLGKRNLTIDDLFHPKNLPRRAG